MQNRTPYMIFSLASLGVLILMLCSTIIAQDDHSHGSTGEARPEFERESPIPLNPSEGSEIGFVYEAYLSPQQEGGEEEQERRT